MQVYEELQPETASLRASLHKMKITSVSINDNENLSVPEDRESSRLNIRHSRPMS